jgi:hypothetical protein
VAQDYGTATVRKHDDGTVTVEQADQVIGVSRDLWDEMELPHKRDDGTLWLDTAGEYRYRFVREDLSWAGPEMDVVVFERIEETPDARRTQHNKENDHEC